MLNSCCKINIPDELLCFYKYEPEDTQNEDEICIDPNVRINRDSRGRVVSVGYYSPDKELIKLVFYDGGTISKINYYREDRLYLAETYKDNLILLKEIFKKDGSFAYSISYEYNQNNQIRRICKKTTKTEVVVIYKFDSLNRIIQRKIIVDYKPYSEQSYSYDVLDRVTGYKDENQKITVNNISPKNELLNYVITDKMGNEITVVNHFTERGYLNSEVSLNGCSISVNDTSYADNIMLKRPYTSEDDLDFVIANLFKNTDTACAKRTDYSDILKNSAGIIDNNIELRTLPISIRKRVLYNIMAKA